MKTSKTVLIILLCLAGLAAMEGGSVAFHSGGVGPCEGCHSIHNSSQGSGGSPVPNAYLLRQTDPSSTCLNCHQRAGDIGPTTYHVSTPVNEVLPGIPPKQLTPGGDFGWLIKNYIWSSPTGTVMVSRGDRHGHNIVALDYGYDMDGTFTAAPGGSYPADRLACTSCHDPHGKYRRDLNGLITTTGRPIANSGSFASSPGPNLTAAVGAYRLLGGNGYRPKSLIAGLTFISNPPAAVAPDRPNRSEAVTQTRVAYGAGMSEWCLNCHPTMHTVTYPGSANLLHPSGNLAKLGLTKTDNYGKYVRTGELTGLWDTSYLSLVPFEEGTADPAALKSLATSDVSVVLTGPGPGAQVMCLTCHRAHASGWDGIMRWNTKTDFIVYNGTYAPAANPEYAQGRTEAEARRAYYDRPASTFALNQDTLCNKCHNGVYP